jgi:hypothetical protein
VRAIFTPLSSFFFASLSSFLAADSLAEVAATRRERVCALAVATLKEHANAKLATNRSAPSGNRAATALSQFEFIALTRIVSSTAKTKDKSPRPRA